MEKARRVADGAREREKALHAMRDAVAVIVRCMAILRFIFASV